MGSLQRIKINEKKNVCVCVYIYIYMAESLHCLTETITTLLIDCTLIQNSLKN